MDYRTYQPHGHHVRARYRDAPAVGAALDEPVRTRSIRRSEAPAAVPAGRLIVFRIRSFNPVPGIDQEILAELFEQQRGGIRDMFKHVLGRRAVGVLDFRAGH
jgi:hypothetical protein